MPIWIKVILTGLAVVGVPLTAMVVAVVLGSKEEDGADEIGAEAYALEMLDDEVQAVVEEEDEKDKKRMTEIWLWRY